MFAAARKSLVVILLAVLAGCSETPATSSGQSPGTGDDAGTPADLDASGAANTRTPDDASTGAPAAPGTQGCGRPATAPGLQTKSTTVAGAPRTYQLVVPEGYDGNRPLPLVFVFHGLGGDAKQIRFYMNMEPNAAGQALFVYPEGAPQASQGGLTAWSAEDVNFFDAMVADVSAALCVDKTRIFAAGHSFGAYMSNLIGCERGDVLRAIAPVSGGMVAGTCKGPVAVWIAHGDKDATVAQSESLSARDRWLKLNACKATSQKTAPGACVAYDDCSAGHPVTWCSFPGGHYPLPDYTEQAIWDFFKAF